MNSLMQTMQNQSFQNKQSKPSLKVNSRINVSAMRNSNLDSIYGKNLQRDSSPLTRHMAQNE